MSDILHAAVLTPLEEAVNHLLASDPLSRKILTPIAGRTIAVELSDLHQTLYILPYEGGVQLQGTLLNSADVTLSGASSRFCQLMMSDDKSEHFFGNGIDIAGDSHLANQFQGALAQLKIDWESLLAEHIGDLAAHESVSLLKQQAGFFTHLQQSFHANVQEYVQEEARILPSRPEAEGVMDQIDQLRQRTDRLAARIEQLNAKLS